MIREAPSGLFCYSYCDTGCCLLYQEVFGGGNRLMEVLSDIGDVK